MGGLNYAKAIKGGNMAHYDNLKDYITANKIDVIEHGIEKHIKSSYSIEVSSIVDDIIIHTLSCTNFTHEVLTVGIGVSAIIHDNNNDDITQYYNISLQGNIAKKLSDLRIIAVKEVPYSELQTETIQSLFGLIDFENSDLETVAETIYTSYISDRITRNDNDSLYSFPLKEVLSKYHVLIKVADLPDGCLGRFFFTNSTANISDSKVHYSHSKKCDITGRTVLISRNYYNEKEGCLDLVTISHEIVHCFLHWPYFQIYMILDESDHLNCSSIPIYYNENDSTYDKAYNYAEWQANELSIRLIMPKHLVEKAIYEFSKSVPDIFFSDNVPKNQFFHSLLFDLSEKFKVPPSISRKRMLQLGYDIFDGMFIDVGNNIIEPPFMFSPGTLNEYESFIIDKINYERLLDTNKNFAELIATNRYVYLGYVVFLNDSKYVKKSKNSRYHDFELTEYAREHADECLIVFSYKSEKNIKYSSKIYGETYLNNIPEFFKEGPESFELCKVNNGLDEESMKEIDKYNNIMNELAKYKTFGNTLVYHMRRKDEYIETLEKKTALSKTIIDKYCKGKSEPVPRNVMTLCIGLKLEKDFIYDMFAKLKNKYDINADTMQNRAYKFIINNGYINSGLSECNKILRVFKQDPLPYTRGNSKNVEE